MAALGTRQPINETTVNAMFASGAATVAQLLVDHPGLTLARISLDTLNLDPATPHPLRAHLQVTGTNRLGDLIAWTGELTDIDPRTHTTLTHRTGYVSLDTHAEFADLPLTVWTHLAGNDLAAVWNQLDEPPGLDDTAEVSLELLRTATGQVSS